MSVLKQQEDEEARTEERRFQEVCCWLFLSLLRWLMVLPPKNKKPKTVQRVVELAKNDRTGFVLPPSLSHLIPISSLPFNPSPVKSSSFVSLVEGLVSHLFKILRNNIKAAQFAYDPGTQTYTCVCVF